MPLKTEILKTLVSGCALNSTIYADVQAYASSKQRFDGTLNELRVAEPALVQSAHYAAPGTDSHLALYALTQDGADNLAVNWYYRPDEIRIVLPARNMVAHELAVTEVVRTIRWEMVRMPYEVLYYDDPACKKMKRHLGLTGWLPDLFLNVISFQNQRCDFSVAIEVDMGSRRLDDVLSTVFKRNCMSLFLCSTSRRIDDLRRELGQYRDLHGMVYFALLNNFCTRPGGVFSINWIDLNGGTVGLYPPI